MISESGDAGAYRATLAHLRTLVGRVETVVPGHGAPIPRRRALEILDEDLAYLQALPDADLPAGRRTATQRRIHEENVTRS
jgi:glyoxylase-like metal-dependent hydrolase (beta-lactamase superfamily II)